MNKMRLMKQMFFHNCYIRKNLNKSFNNVANNNSNFALKKNNPQILNLQTLKAKKLNI